MCERKIDKREMRQCMRQKEIEIGALERKKKKDSGKEIQLSVFYVCEKESESVCVREKRKIYGCVRERGGERRAYF